MPVSDCEVRDPRIRRTRRLLQEALGTLMQSKSFDEISVQDIAEAATVNRATFYDHYTDKYALLDAMVAGGFHQLLHERNVRYDGTCPAAIGALILATCDYLTRTHSASECARQSAFEPLIESAITTTMRRVLMAGMPATGTDQPPQSPTPQMIASAASWAIYGAVKEWFHGPSPSHRSAEEIVPGILLLVLPMLAPHALDSAPAGPGTLPLAAHR
jgi:AcrR family transcriptional regulator